MKRKIFSVLFAVVLVASFSLVTAVPAAAVEPPPAAPDATVIPFELGGKAEGYYVAEWEYTEVHQGSSSVHLKTTGTEGPLGTGDEARILIDFSDMPGGEELTLGYIESISWYEYLVAGYPPHLDISLDFDDDGVRDDILVFEYAYNTEAHAAEGGQTYGAVIDGWYPTFNDDGEGPSVIDANANAWLGSGPPGPLTGPGSENFIYGTLAEWKLGEVDPSVDANTVVLALEIEVDNWIVQTEAYVDDIYIKGVGEDVPTLIAGQIQDAIDSVSGESPFIYVMPGTYREYLHITTDGLWIEGAGIDQSIIDLEGLIPYWHYGTNKSFASRAGVLITGYGSTDEIIEDVTFRGFTVKNAGLNPPITATGTHTGSDDAAILTDSAASWTEGELVGEWVHNYGDKDPADWNPARSYGQITANTENTVTVALSGGVDADWDTGDPYLITPYEEFHNTVWVHYPNYDALRGISIGNGRNVLIQYCKVINNGYGGISVGKARLGGTYSEGVTIDHCIVSDHLVVGISIGNHKGAITVTNNLVERNERPAYTDPTRENSGRGIEVSGTSVYRSTGLIADNIVNDNGFEGIILSKYSDGVVVEDNTVTGHNLDQDGAGIFFYGHDSDPANCQNNIIRNNTVTGNIRGIVAYYAQGGTIEGNTITTDSGTFDSGQAAIKIDGGNTIIVKDNIIISCDGVGIRVTNTWNDVESYANTFTGNTITDAKFAGVRITKGAYDNTFEYNTITGTNVLEIVFQLEGETQEQGDGVFIDDDAGTGNIFHWNDIYGNAGDGMENQVTTTTVDASMNYWGDPSGPTFEGTGQFYSGAGDSVSDNVNFFSPEFYFWLTRDFQTVIDDNICYFGFPMVWLNTGWNTLSTPIALDPACATWGSYKELGDGLSLYNTEQEYVNAYYFLNNGEDQGFVEVDDNYRLRPCDAIYVQMAEPDIAAILWSPDVSISSKELYAGWNLVSFAPNPKDDDWCKPAGFVLRSVEQVPGDLHGYKLAVNPPVNWYRTKFDWPQYWPGEGAHLMCPTLGYWVLMNNDGTLAGLSSTPIPLMPRVQ